MYTVRTELEKKLHKLPDDIEVDFCIYVLLITKIATDKYNDEWFIEYKDESGNTLLSVQHNTFQAAVDNTLREIKKLTNGNN